MFRVYRQTTINTGKTEYVCRRKVVAEFASLVEAMKYVEKLDDVCDNKEYVLGYRFAYSSGINTSTTFFYVYIGWRENQKSLTIDYTIG